MTLIQGLAKLVNETMRDYENVRAVEQNLKGFSGLSALYTFHRHRPGVFKDGEVAYRRDGSKDKVAKRYCFLLPAALILCQSKGTTYIFKELIELHKDAEVENLLEAPKQAVSGRFRESFKIITSDKEEHILSFRSEAYKTQWMRATLNNIAAMMDTATKPRPTVPEPKKVAAVAAKRKDKITGSPRNSVADPTPPDTPSGEDLYPMAKATRDGSDSPTPKTPVDPLARMPWYLGKASAPEADRALRGKLDGTFLLRESKRRPGEYTLGVWWQGKTIHFAVNTVEQEERGKTVKKYFITLTLEEAKDAVFDSVVDLIIHFKDHLVAGNCPTCLVLPYKEA
eukprot:m.55585 g.55585  ORF g.55585 m.55585 type:complete len:340 (+) comp15547_c0_seq6:481-1500(+)